MWIGKEENGRKRKEGREVGGIPPVVKLAIAERA